MKVILLRSVLDNLEIHKVNELVKLKNLKIFETSLNILNKYKFNYASCSIDAKIVIWSGLNKKVLASEASESYHERIFDMIMLKKSPRKLLATASSLKSVKIWEIIRDGLKIIGINCVSVMTYHSSKVESLLEYEPRKDTLISASRSELIVSDYIEKNMNKLIKINVFNLTAYGNNFFGGVETGKLIIFNESFQYFEVKVHERNLLCVLVINVADEIVCTAGEDTKIKIWRVNSNRANLNEVRPKRLGMLNGHNAPILSLIKGRETNTIISGSIEIIRIWNYKKFECIKSFILKNFDGGLSYFNMTYLIYGSPNGTQYVVDSNGKLVDYFKFHFYCPTQFLQLDV